MITKPKYNKLEKTKLMKESRQKVRDYISGKKRPKKSKHLGDTFNSVTEGKRIVIALQDLLTRSMARHKKASDLIYLHIRNTRNLTNQVLLMEKRMDRNIKFLDKKDADIRSLNKENQELRSDIFYLEQKNELLKEFYKEELVNKEKTQ